MVKKKFEESSCDMPCSLDALLETKTVQKSSVTYYRSRLRQASKRLPRYQAKFSKPRNSYSSSSDEESFNNRIPASESRKRIKSSVSKSLVSLKGACTVYSCESSSESNDSFTDTYSDTSSDSSVDCISTCQAEQARELCPAVSEKYNTISSLEVGLGSLVVPSDVSLQEEFGSVCFVECDSNDPVSLSPSSSEISLKKFRPSKGLTEKEFSDSCAIKVSYNFQDTEVGSFFQQVRCSSAEFLLKSNKEAEWFRMCTFINWPFSSPYSTCTMAYLGFFRPQNAADDDDVAICYVCGWEGRNWTAVVTPLLKHKREAPDCDLLQDDNSSLINQYEHMPLNVSAALKGKIAGTSKEQDTGTFTDFDNALLKRYLQQLLAHGGLRNEVELHRLCSYLHSNWPASQAPVSPLLLAKSGFCYLGDRDRVRCHFCDNVLRDWEPGDDPASEHQRHFPDCDFVKGFHTANVPWDGKTLPNFIAMGGTWMETLPTTERTKPSEKQPCANLTNGARNETFVDKAQASNAPNVQDRSQVTGIVEGPMASSTNAKGVSKRFVSELLVSQRLQSRLCSRLLKHGYQKSILAATIRQRLETDDGDFPTVYELIKAYRLFEAATASEATTKKKSTCRICLDNQACVIFLPCGHLCCCTDCARDLKACPLCRVKISNKDVLNFN